MKYQNQEITVPINQINSMNRKARKFLLSHNISKKGAEVALVSFTGYINGNYVKEVTLMRLNGKWEIFATHEKVQSICGEAYAFFLTAGSLY